MAKRARDIMTPQVACCLKEATLQSVAQLMVQYDCGEIPVVVSQEDPRPVGVVTDRDIVCRAVAEGRDPKTVRADEIMTAPAITVVLDTPFDDCMALMRDRKIRRLPVLDEQGRVAGIIAQADIARHRGPRETGKMVERVSTPSQN